MGYKISAKVVIITIIVIIIIVLLIAALVMKGGKKQKEQRRLTMEKLREEALDRALENPARKQAAEDAKGVQRPFAVNYGQDEKTFKKEQTAGGRCMLQLTEINELSTRKYLVNPSELITVGKQFDANTIVINNRKLSDRQFEIFQYGQDLYIRSCGGPVTTVLVRKADSVIVDERGIKLQTGDCINAGPVRLEVDIIRRV